MGSTSNYFFTFSPPLIIYFENIPALPLDIEWLPPNYSLLDRHQILQQPIHILQYKDSTLAEGTLCIAKQDCPIEL